MNLLNTHGGNVELLAPQYGLQVEDVLDFSANINPYGPPPGTFEILSQSWQDISRYPDPHCTQLKLALALWHNVQPENITAANGAAELIYWIARLFPAPRALVLGPTFTEYADAVESADGSVKYEFSQESDGFRHDFDHIKNAPEDPVRLVFIANPNNPTGTFHEPFLLKKWILQTLSDFARAGLKSAPTVIIDESFLPFTGAGPESLSLAAFAAQTPGVILLRSMTKIFSIPGLRLGYYIAHSQTAKNLENLMPPWRVNILAQRFGEKISSFSQFLNNSRKMIETHRNDLIRNLRELTPLKVFDSTANFILIKLLAPDKSSTWLTNALAKKGILIRSCNDFMGLEKNKFIRIAVRRPEENKVLVEALQSHVG